MVARPGLSLHYINSLKVAACCLLWLTCSTAIVLVNRSIILEGFPHPITLSCMGQMTAFIVSGLIVYMSRPPPTDDSTSTEHEEEQQTLLTKPLAAPEITWHFWTTHVAPVGAAQGVGIWLSNVLYLLLTVAFIEMARSLLPLLTLLALWAASLQTPTNSQITAVVLSAVGCSISAYGEAHLVPLGLLVLGLSFGLEITRMLLLQYLMQQRQQSSWQTVYAVSGPAAGTLFVLMWIIEGRKLIASNAGTVIIRYWPAFVLASFLGICTMYVTNLVIQLSSATTVKLLAAIRGPLIVTCGMLVYAEKVAPMQLLGYSVALCGFVWYSLSPGNPKHSTPANSTQLRGTGKQPEDPVILVFKTASGSHELSHNSTTKGSDGAMLADASKQGNF